MILETITAGEILDIIDQQIRFGEDVTLFTHLHIEEGPAFQSSIFSRMVPVEFTNWTASSPSLLKLKGNWANQTMNLYRILPDAFHRNDKLVIDCSLTYYGAEFIEVCGKESIKKQYLAKTTFRRLTGVDSSMVKWTCIGVEVKTD